MRRFLRTVAIAVTSLTAVVSSYAVQASDYPSRPITIVVPYGPGGASDL